MTIAFVAPIPETMEINAQTHSEFNKLGECFIQDFELIVPTFDGALDFILRQFKGNERGRLRAFLDEVTRDDISDEELQNLWLATQADIVFHTGADLRRMLKSAGDRL